MRHMMSIVNDLRLMLLLVLLRVLLLLLLLLRGVLRCVLLHAILHRMDCSVRNNTSREIVRSFFTCSNKNK